MDDIERLETELAEANDRITELERELADCEKMRELLEEIAHLTRNY